MGWFDEQIRQRKEGDQEAFEDSMLELGAAVLGESGAGFLREQQFVTKDAVDEILKFYRCKPTEIPSSITDPQEQLEAALRPHGLAYRKIQLAEGWYKNTFGPLIALRKEDGAPVVLRPRAYSGYTWQEADGRKVTANAKTVQLLENEALCFYLPLPRKKLGMGMHTVMPRWRRPKAQWDWQVIPTWIRFPAGPRTPCAGRCSMGSFREKETAFLTPRARPQGPSWPPCSCALHSFRADRSKQAKNRFMQERESRP